MGTALASSTTTSSAAFRAACGEFATGVTAVTARDQSGAVAALTVNSFTSVSLDPPLILVCIGKATTSAPVLERASHVAVHVLRGEQEEVARRLATKRLTGAERLAGIPYEDGPHGVPLLHEFAARFSGPVSRRVDAGDHVLLLIAADSVEVPEAPAAPLIFLRGRYAR